MEDVDKHILVRGIWLSALGKLDNDTVKIAARLDVPHHEGAGGIEDFADQESFQKHVKRVSNRKKRKRQKSTISYSPSVMKRLHRPLNVRVPL